MTGGAILERWAVQVVERRRLRRKDSGAHRVRGVALQAQGGQGGAHQHFGIVGAVRLVATLAAAHPDARMLKDKGPLFFVVAFEADLLAGEAGTKLPAVDAAVGLMAVGALDRVFLHPVMERLRKIGLLLGVATHAQIAGPLLQHGSQGSGLVGAVAVGAVQPLLGMGAGAEAGDLVILFMAGQALLVVRLEGLAFETDGLGFIAAAINVSLAGAVAGFAGVGDLIERALLEDVVRIFGECVDNVLVTSGAVLHGGSGLLG